MRAARARNTVLPADRYCGFSPAVSGELRLLQRRRYLAVRLDPQRQPYRGRALGKLDDQSPKGQRGTWMAARIKYRGLVAKETGQCVVPLVSF